MILDQTEIVHTLRLDEDEVDNIAIGESFVEAIPDYISIATGLDKEVMTTSPTALQKTAAKFILTLWYHPDSTDARLQQQTIENLLRTLKATHK